MAAPIANGFVASIFQRLVAAFYSYYLSSEQTHFLHIGALALHIKCAHVHHTGHSHQRTHCGSGHTMLSGTSFGHNAFLSHAACNQYLANGIVYFVCASMVEVLAFQIHFAAMELAQVL